MTPNQPDEGQLLGRYLLGESLPDAELERIEEQYFSDDNYFDRLLAVEDDLIDRYIRNELQGRERAQFQSHFLSSPRRREKWEAQEAMAEFFRSSARPAPFLIGLRRFLQTQSIWVRAGLATAAIGVVVGVGLLGWGYSRLRGRDGAQESALIAASTRVPTDSRLAFSLDPGLVRSGAGTVLSIAAGTGWVTLTLRLNATEHPAHSFFVATLTTVEGEEMWRQSRLVSTGGSVQVEIPSSVLPRGDFVLSLATVAGNQHTELPSYVFRVER